MVYDTIDPNVIFTKFGEMVDILLEQEFQGYQMRRSQVLEDDTYEVNEDIIRHIKDSDDKFFDQTTPLCREYIDQYTRRDKTTVNGYKPVAKIPHSKTHRSDIVLAVSNVMYPLHKINKILDADNGTNEVATMINTGVMSKRNMKSLFKTTKAAAEAEDVEFDEETQERFNEVNEDDLPDTDDEDFD
ncbi:hypothetical protein AM587_10005625 [Phytophthora nicotianae]|nr:hypothetical protein AM587_10005625 [Phytophthora nicotianae]